MGGVVELVGEDLPAWLKEGRESSQDEWVHRVGELLPGGFDAYLRLFHPFLPWGADPESTEAGDHRSWKSLAEEAGVEFSGVLTWRQLEPVLPPEGDRRRLQVVEGDLEPVVRRRLFSALAERTPPQPAYFFYGLSAITGDRRAAALFEAPLNSTEDVFAVARSEGFSVDTAELAWPEDRSWVVCADYDLTSTYIAARRELADALGADEGLEIAEVDRGTRIDSAADEERASA